MTRKSTALVLTPDERAALERLARSGKTEQRLALRSRIVLRAAAGSSDSAIARELSTSRPTVADWRRRWVAEGLAGLTRDRPRGRGFAPMARDQEALIIEKTLHTEPPAGTHWSCRSMANASGVSKASVQRIWSAHGLKPHLVRTFKLSNDPKFVEKLQDVVGLYMSPPENAVVLSIDEKSQIQPAPGGRRLQPEGPMQGGIGGALDRTQPGLPLKKGRAGTMTHDYKRNGTTTLFAALDVLKGLSTSSTSLRGIGQAARWSSGNA